MMFGAPSDWRRVTLFKSGDDLVGDAAGTAQDIRFPEAQDDPARLLKRTSLAAITLDVPLDLRSPIRRVMSPSELGKPSGKVATVPEVAIAEDYNPGLREDDVGTTGQARLVKSIAQTAAPQLTT